MNPAKCYIQLGRHGDLLIVLRALKLIADHTGKKVKLMVSKDYADTLDGVSYIERIVIPMDWYGGMAHARAMAQAMFKEDYAVLQCHGFNWGIDMSKAPNFMESMWSRTGVPMDLFKTAPLVIDQRSPEREAELAKRLELNGKPLLLVNFKGTSSPFHHFARVLAVIRQMREEFQIVDLAIPNAKCPRIYDLLGVYERAAGIVTSDTATMHLAWACKIPVMAYIVDGWTGSTPPPTTVFQCRYANTMGQIVDLQKALRRCLEKSVVKAEIYHAYSDYPAPESDTKRRVEIAQKSWTAQPWTELPIKDEILPRMFSDGARRFPYIRDLLDFACNGKADSAIIVFSNSDIHMRSDLCRRVEQAMLEMDAVYCFRRDFHHRVMGPIPDAQFTQGRDYAGSDLYAFKAGWWRKNRDAFPDMLAGNEGWDAIFRILIERTNHGKNVCLKDLIAHERHGGLTHWEHPTNRYTRPSQKHNLRLAWKWCLTHGVNPHNHAFRQV